MTALSAERARRLADFQQGRAPEIAALVSTRRRGAASAPRNAEGMLAEAIGILAGAAGMPARPVCERCTRTLNRRGRTCRWCGYWNPRDVGWPASRQGRAA